jgi:hypothetical protein
MGAVPLGRENAQGWTCATRTSVRFAISRIRRVALNETRDAGTRRESKRATAIGGSFVVRGLHHAARDPAFFPSGPLDHHRTTTKFAHSS